MPGIAGCGYINRAAQPEHPRRSLSPADELISALVVLIPSNAMTSSDRPEPEPGHTQGPPAEADQLKRIVAMVATLNFAYFFVEFAVALSAGSVSLLADSVDFLEDTAINLLIFIALGWPLARRAVMAKQ
jgi:hypothetical protein